MQRLLAGLLAAVVGIMPNFITKNFVGSAEIEGSYAIHAGNYDWGSSVNRIVLTLNAPIDHVSAGDFKVQTEKDINVYMVGMTHQVEELKVLNAYLCDKDGNQTDKASPYVALEIEVGPDKASPFLVSQAAMMNIYAEPYTCSITLTDQADWTSKGIEVTSFEIAPNAAAMTTDADMFRLGSYQSTSGVQYDYAAYTPDQKSDTLVVWLHGLCEGKTLLQENEKSDPYITCLSAEVTALADEAFQSIIGGANVLVPQCPTYWMDADGKCSNMDGSVINADGTSYYTESLHELINDYKEKCGAEKVLIAGCSNGGYMGMVLATTYTDEYDGYVLICEAMPDQYLTDVQLQAIKDLPLYFVYSNDDPIVVPSLHEIPTVARLRAMGATNLHISTTDHVVDMSGQYKNADGTPHQYFGHNSWIYFFNNETSCDDCGMDAWRWMAEQLQ